MADDRTRAHRVAVLASPEVIAFELAIPGRILGGALDDDGRALYDVRVASLDGGPVRTSDGWAVQPEHGPEAFTDAGTLVVPASRGTATIRDGEPDPAVAALLRDANGRARVMSICTGAFALAAAGLLDGRPATTHWLFTNRFRRLFPQVRLNPDVLFVDDGDVLTSAGNAAGIDLCLHLIRRDHGAEVAASVARRNVVAPWREGGQSQFVERPVPHEEGPGTAAARAWALQNLDRPLTLAELAEGASMSERTFTRRFRAETGLSPSRWLAARRVELARRLLETTDLPVDRLAARAGFGSPASMRMHLGAEIGMSPLAYRRAHRAPADG
ncbi:AraC family transcriptional regulator with amidase-like domain [Pseudonocardia sediminis]|uniref:AraC family transcriptional regulator with amidase-like domain n=1 Tax=Pseudonocardia sediminis TaxID=1397368 RepID=A0A4Q7USG7_PSEST|nr:helix-turn-helix domain-containing protein [Pseudonocardia sediminis]RZT83768.1 AraC family transcriptional regulator with amidase-like domain [Pseudonocardia sediminis]